MIGTKILYYIIILPISVLPYFLLYRLSDFMYLLLYYVFGYRKKVIQGNIYKSFPDKSEKEKKKIVKKFYKHFCDLIVESIKNFTISEAQIKKRIVFENVELLDDLYDRGKSIIIVGGHYGNWEMLAVAVGGATKHDQYGIYKPLSNTFFDNKMKMSRGKLGTKLVSMKETKKCFETDFENPISIIFGSDQWPSNAKRAFWTTFLGRETSFLFGAEKYANDFDRPAVYCDIIKTKRGHFKVRFKMLSETPKNLEYGELTNCFIKELEKTIRNEPAFWLWSHKRWKKTKKEVFDEK